MVCRMEGLQTEEHLKVEDQRGPRHRLGACPPEVCQREECRREGCLKEAMVARWWHQHASRWQRRQSEPGAFPRAVFRKAVCLMEALPTEEPRREVGRVAQCRTEEARMGCRKEEGERWTCPLASRSRRRLWQLVAHQTEAHQRAGRPREEAQKALQQEECRRAVGQRTLQREEVLRAFRSEEGGGCSHLPS